MDIALPLLRRTPIDTRTLKARSWLAVGLFQVVAFAVLLAQQVGAVASIELPELPVLAPLAQDSRIVDAKGRTIALLHGEEHRNIITRDQMASPIIPAVLAAEDHRFYEHGGINGSSMVRALLANMKEGEIEQGGSTITQQYVRNAFEEVGKDRTLGRKVNEAWLATRLERERSKDEILDGYLNTIYFGRGAYGIEAASREYFGKPASAITLPEAAFLAGIIKAPQTLAANPEAAKIRRDYVIRRMLELELVSQASANAAWKTPLNLKKNTPEPVRAAHFVEYVRRLLVAPVDQGGFGLTDREVLSGGLTIYTTLDLDAQAAAERAVLKILPDNTDPEAALVSMTTKGQIRAMVGGRHFTDLEKARGFNYATQISPGAGRSAGSTFKPFTLAAYLRAGYSARDVFPAPKRVKVDECGDGRKPWTPGNYGDNGYGRMDVIRATELSVNTVYAQMVARVGGAAVVAAARDAGITTPLLPVCSITLGTFGVTPLEMARAYATFAGRGMRPDPMAVTKIVAPGGKTIAERAPHLERTIEPEIADQVNAILERVVEDGTGRPAAIPLTAAGKTGTTEKKRDAWFVGYTPAPGLSTAVWMGYPPDKDGRVPIMTTLHGRSVSGGGFAGRIWSEYMRRALAGIQDRPFAAVQFARSIVKAPRAIETEVDVPVTPPTTVVRQPAQAPPPPPPPQQTASPTPEPAPTQSQPPDPEPQPSSSPQPSQSAQPARNSSPSPSPTSGS